MRWEVAWLLFSYSKLSLIHLWKSKCDFTKSFVPLCQSFGDDRSSKSIEFNLHKVDCYRMYKVNAWFKDKVYLNDDDYIDSIAQYDQTNLNKNFKISSIYDKCSDRVIMRITVKPYILLKSLFQWICSKFYKFKHGHDLFWPLILWRLLEAKNTSWRPKYAWRSQFMEKSV